jgi:hypothetical protein
MYWYSVWRDTEAVIDGVSASYIDYKITLNTEDDVFYGRAYKLPGENDIKINVNKIVQQYCPTPYLGWNWTGYYNTENLYGWAIRECAPVTDLYVYYNGAWVNRITQDDPWHYNFIYDYDYEYESHTQFFDYQDGYGGGERVAAIGTNNDITNLHIPGQFHFESSVVPSQNTAMTFSYADARGYPKWTNSATSRCGRYALIYVNLRGGIDTFPILGSYKKKDNITRYSLDRSFNNINRSQFEKDNYASTVATSYELNTHYLTDEESYNLARNLLGSNKVYLQDIERQFVCPVVITDSQVTYQTYQTNGKRLSQYIINVTESQSKIRR